MKTTIIALLLLPVISFSQTRNVNVDHHIKARNSAYTSMAITGAGLLMAGGMISVDPDNIDAAAGIGVAFGIAALAFHIKSWHHVGQAGRQRTACIGVSREGLTLALNF